MKATVLGFIAAEPGAGNVSRRVAEALKIPHVSVGEYVRKLAGERGVPPTCEALDRLEEALARQEARALCVGLLSQAPWHRGMALVIEGVARPEVARVLGELVAPSPFRRIYLKADGETPPPDTDLVLDGSRSVDQLVQEVVAFARRSESSWESADWGERNARRIELARKKNREGLSPEESAEYDDLQRSIFEDFEASYPFPCLDTESLDRIEARLKAAERAAGGR